MRNALVLARLTAFVEVAAARSFVVAAHAAGAGRVGLPAQRSVGSDLPSGELVWRRLEAPLMSRESGVIIRTGYSLAPTVIQFLQVLDTAFEQLSEQVAGK